MKLKYSLFKLLTVVLILGLALAIVANHRTFSQRIRAYEEEAKKREALEDGLEDALMKELVPGTLLNEYPYYFILVDEVYTPSDPDHPKVLDFLERMEGMSPSTLKDCEIHSFRTEAYLWVVIVRDNRCIEVLPR